MLQAARIIGIGLANTNLVIGGFGFSFEVLITGLSFIRIHYYTLLYIFLCIMIPVLILYFTIKLFKRDPFFISIHLVSLYIKVPTIAILHITGKTQFIPLVILVTIPVLVIFRKFSKNLTVEKIDIIYGLIIGLIYIILYKLLIHYTDWNIVADIYNIVFINWSFQVIYTDGHIKIIPVSDKSIKSLNLDFNRFISQFMKNIIVLNWDALAYEYRGTEPDPDLYIPKIIYDDVSLSFENKAWGVNYEIEKYPYTNNKWLIDTIIYNNHLYQTENNKLSLYSSEKFKYFEPTALREYFLFTHKHQLLNQSNLYLEWQRFKLISETPFIQRWLLSNCYIEDVIYKMEFLIRHRELERRPNWGRSVFDVEKLTIKEKQAWHLNRDLQVVRMFNMLSLRIALAQAEFPNIRQTAENVFISAVQLRMKELDWRVTEIKNIIMYGRTANGLEVTERLGFIPHRYTLGRSLIIDTLTLVQMDPDGESIKTLFNRLQENRNHVWHDESERAPDERKRMSTFKRVKYLSENLDKNLSKIYDRNI